MKFFYFIPIPTSPPLPPPPFIFYHTYAWSRYGPIKHTGNRFFLTSLSNGRGIYPQLLIAPAAAAADARRATPTILSWLAIFGF